ncbi:MAG: cytochrome d ubiquinol oxidase subunit II [Bacteroidaceae bacterium]
MFEKLNDLALQQYWWFLISLLGALLVFLMFVQGGQTLLSTLSKTKTERNILVNSLGRKWEFTFTTLVTFGGAFFASFPLFYSTSFGGAYWVWMLILIAFVGQAVSYEFRSKPGNPYGTIFFDCLLFTNGLLGTILIGIAVATFFTGSNFTIDPLNHMTWNSSWRGLEAAFNLHNLLLGFTIFFLTRVLAILYFFNSIANESILKRAYKQLIINTIPFLICFLSFVIWLMLRDGFAVMGDLTIVMVPFKYFTNLIEMPIVAILFIIGVVLVLSGIIITLIKKNGLGIWFSGAGTILTVLMLLLLAGYNHTAFYPSLTSLQSSLTIQNASSSRFTLITMGYVSLMIPFVMAYIFYAWRSLNKKKIDATEIEDKNNHTY